VSGEERPDIRDYLFRETVSCPLKYRFILDENFNDQREDLFRRKTKRMTREAVARLFDDTEYTSNSAEVAAEETQRWLMRENVTICGAVLKNGNLRARIPILMKKGDELTIIQVHGKLVKENADQTFAGVPLGRSLNRYLLQAAYRQYVTKLAYPDALIRCSFMFPSKSFESGSDKLFQKTQGKDHISEEALEEIRSLYATVDGTLKVLQISKKIPADVSHSSFSGMSIEEAISKVYEVDEAGGRQFVDSVHLGCRNCRFRKADSPGGKGCWEIHFHDSDMKQSDKHLFELIGHHVTEEHLSAERFQEQVLQPSGLSNAGEIISHTERKIAIYHRKAMQLLDAKGRDLPLVFGKGLLAKLGKLEFPLHFIDFEAATHPVPMSRGEKPYTPAIFQFSCHTLTENLNLVHTQWLDEQTDEAPHKRLVSELGKIPGIEKGTIMQFSPFERQAFYKLYSEMRRSGAECEEETAFLEKLLRVKSHQQKDRFLDLSAMIRDGYYNRFMNSGLSLKQILLSILKVEEQLKTMPDYTFDVSDMSIDLLRTGADGEIANPYSQISDQRSSIRDGITAMHAYFCLKAGVLSEEQNSLVSLLMKRYCSLDSLALYIVYKHLLNIAGDTELPDDVVIYS